jgi:hypothetical protein
MHASPNNDANIKKKESHAVSQDKDKQLFLYVKEKYIYIYKAASRAN